MHELRLFGPMNIRSSSAIYNHTLQSFRCKMKAQEAMLGNSPHTANLGYPGNLRNVLGLQPWIFEFLGFPWLADTVLDMDVQSRLSATHDTNTIDCPTQGMTASPQMMHRLREMRAEP